MEVGDDEDYHFVLKAYGKSKNVVHIPTEIDALEQAFAEYHDRLNCFIVELAAGCGRHENVRHFLPETGKRALRPI